MFLCPSQNHSPCLASPNTAACATLAVAAAIAAVLHPRHGQSTTEQLQPFLLSFMLPHGSMMFIDLLVFSGARQSHRTTVTMPVRAHTRSYHREPPLLCLGFIHLASQVEVITTELFHFIAESIMVSKW